MSHELLRPRSVTELLDVSFTLIRTHFAVFATLAAVAALPLLAVSSVTIALLPDATEVANGTAVANVGQTLLMIPFSIIGWLWLFIAGSALIFATADAYRGLPVEAGSAFRRAMRATGDVLGASIAKYVALFGIMLLGGIAVGMLAGGVIAAGLPSSVTPILAVVAVFAVIAIVIVMTLRWFVVTSVAALEGVTGSDALGRSAKLMRQAGGRAFLVMLVMIALGFSLSLVSTVLLAVAGTFAGSNALAAVANSVWLLIYPLANVVEAALYFDQRIRTEGFDLEVLSQQLGPTAAATESPFAQQPS